MLKLGFLRCGTLYPIFVVLKDLCFFYATFLKICFTEAPPQFLPETKRFARVKDSSRFSALCDLPETIRNIFEKFRIFFLNFVFQRFFVEKDGFFAVFSWGRMVFENVLLPLVLYDIVHLVFESSQVFAKHDFASVNYN